MSLRLGDSHHLERLQLLQKITAVHDMVELEQSLTAAQLPKQLFERVGWIVCMDADCSQISGVAKPDIQLRKCVAAFERQSAGFVGAADKIVYEQQFVKQRRREK